MTKSIVADAWDYGEMKHSGQMDDSGKPYFRHCIQVYELVNKVAPEDYNLQAAALLHDVVEDTDATYGELVEKFNPDVANLVMEVTHEGKKDDYGFYFPRLKTQRGIMLKLADRLSNLSRMDPWNERRKKHYLKKTKFWKDGSDLPNSET